MALSLKSAIFVWARAVPSCCLRIGSWCQSMWWSQSPCGRRTCHSRNLDRGVMSVCWPSREMSTEFLHCASTAPPCSVRTHRWGCLEARFTCWCLQWPLLQPLKLLHICFNIWGLRHEPWIMQRVCFPTVDEEAFGFRKFLSPLSTLVAMVTVFLWWDGDEQPSCGADRHLEWRFYHW